MQAPPRRGEEARDVLRVREAAHEKGEWGLDAETCERLAKVFDLAGDPAAAKSSRERAAALLR